MSGRSAEKHARVAARVGVLGLALLGAACGGNDEGPGAQAQMRGRGGPDAVTPVAVAAVERGSIARSVSVSGVVEPIRSVGVNAQVAGALLSVNVEEGSMVQRGQVLARIDDRELRAQLLSAEAQLEVARSAYERAEQLRDRKVITLPEYERDRAAYAAAQATVDQLRTRVGYTTVNAPVSGVVTAKLVEAGDVVLGHTLRVLHVLRGPLLSPSALAPHSGRGSSRSSDARPRQPPPRASKHHLPS